MIRFRLLLFVWISIGGLYAEIRLPVIFSENRVLQQESEVAVRYALKDFPAGELPGNEGILVSSLQTDKL
jgi:hypothetical protein